MSKGIQTHKFIVALNYFFKIIIVDIAGTVFAFVTRRLPMI